MLGSQVVQSMYLQHKTLMVPALTFTADGVITVRIRRRRGAWTYVEHFNGSDSFTVTVTD